MTEFDEQQLTERLIELYRERGEELTAEVVVRRARKRFGRGISLYEALERLEDLLLSHNPNPETWD